MNKSRNISGQALIQFLITSAGFLVLFVLILTFSWLILTSYQIESQMQSALICISNQNKSVCEMNLKRDLKKVLLWGNIDQVRTENNPSEIRIRLQYHLQNTRGFHFDKVFSANLQK